MSVTLYSDGAAIGNPGPGGYGVVMESGKHRKEMWGGYRMSTNNRMELLAVIVVLEALKAPGTDVVVVSDSKYVVDSVEKGWVFDWEKKFFECKQVGMKVTQDFVGDARLPRQFQHVHKKSCRRKHEKPAASTSA